MAWPVFLNAARLMILVRRWVSSLPKYRVLPVEHVLVQVELVVLVALDVLSDDALGEVIGVAIEVVDAHVLAVGAPPLAAFLVHRLEALDRHPRGEAVGREPRVLQHVVEPVPDHDVVGGDLVGDEPLDDGLRQLDAGVDQRRPDRVDLDADPVAGLEQQGEAVSHGPARECRDPPLEHRGDDLRIEPVVDQGLRVLHLDHLPGERARQGVFPFRHLHEISQVRLHRRRGCLRLGGRHAEHDSPGGHRARADGLHEVSAVHSWGAVNRSVRAVSHDSDLARGWSGVRRIWFDFERVSPTLVT